MITNRKDLAREIRITTYAENGAFAARIIEETGLDGFYVRVGFHSGKVSATVSKNGTSKTQSLNYPFEADDFWMMFDDLAEQVDDDGYNDDSWLDYWGDE
jgi:hypothetical protein